MRRTFCPAVQSELRRWRALPCLHGQDGLPRLFVECFEKHVRMRRGELWREFPAFWASIEDPPYLEEKCATLMMAVEMFIRCSLVENGCLTIEDAQTKQIGELVGMARKALRWDIPNHYTAKERYRNLRNAAAHGNRVALSSDLLRHEFDKWRLFLTRRLFMQLGFTGIIRSPRQGWAASSPVSEFSEEHNSFDPSK